ncbi:MAG TPA: hypothetical protein VMN78_07820 [Longimicrobiales bacterium]|nr:hypothetical protein [Longimicrobiales bacterium]
MRSILVLILLLGSSATASAQSSVTLRGGASLPYGDFDRGAEDRTCRW